MIIYISLLILFLFKFKINIDYIIFDLNMLYPVNEKLTKNTLYCISKVPNNWIMEEIKKCMNVIL